MFLNSDQIRFEIVQAYYDFYGLVLVTLYSRMLLPLTMVKKPLHYFNVSIVHKINIKI